MTLDEDIDAFWDYVWENYGVGVPLSPEDSQRLTELTARWLRELSD